MYVEYVCGNVCVRPSIIYDGKTNWICNLHYELSNIDLNNSTISQPQLIPKEEILCLCCRIAVEFCLHNNLSPSRRVGDQQSTHVAEIKRLL